MANRRKLLLILAPLLAIAVVALTFPTGAFTATSVERGVTVSVAEDDEALVALIDGHPGGLVEQTSEGTLTIDFTNGGGQGANEEAKFTLGSHGTPSSNNAFRIVNQGTQTRGFEFSYSLTNSNMDGDTDENLLFTFYFDTNDDSTLESFTLSEENTQASVPSVGVGESIYVVVDLDSNGLTQSADLSGTLEVTAGGGS